MKKREKRVGTRRLTSVVAMVLVASVGLIFGAADPVEEALRPHRTAPAPVTGSTGEAIPESYVPAPSSSRPLPPQKFVTAEVQAITADQVESAREAGIDEMSQAGRMVTVEIPVHLVASLRAQGLNVRIIERFLQVVVSPGEADPEQAGGEFEPLPAGQAVCSDLADGNNQTDYNIPDDPDSCNDGGAGFKRSTVSISGFAGEVVCKVVYAVRIVHAWPGDITAQLNNSQHSTGDGAPIWDRYGGSTDGGADDDVDDDDDIWLNWRETSRFNGDAVNGSWYLDVWDNCPGDIGNIDYVFFRVYYAGASEIRVEPTSLAFDCEPSAAVAAAAASDGAVAGETPPQLAPADKLIDSEAILAPFGQQKTTTDVIVMLVSPVQLRAATDWDDRNSLSALQAEVKNRREAVLARLTNAEISVRYRYENLAGFSGSVTQAGLNKLLADPMVRSVEPVRELQANTNQGIPLINALGTRPTFNGAGVSIAICDSGIDYTHPRLGNGGFPNSKVIGGIDVGDGDPDPMPPSGGSAHGTACAGIAAGNLGTVGNYIGGVAPGARLYAVKIAEGATGGASSAAMIAGWDWCVTHKNDDPANPIMVISTSFGGGRNTAVCDALTPAMTAAADNAVAAGITVLASSANDGFCNAMAWPACISSVISVGAVYDANVGRNPDVGFTGCISPLSCAGYTVGCVCSSGGCYVDNTTAADQVTTYSNTASFLDILAPAEDAHTTDIVGAGGYAAGSYTTDFGGTSAACPYAAGAVAALQSAAMNRTGSYLSPAEVRSTLISTGVPITDGKVNITKPRVDLGAAIDTIGCDGEYFRIHNDGGDTLTVNSITGVPGWATLDPPPPYSIPAGTSQAVCVRADCNDCAGDNQTANITINSNDASRIVNITIQCEKWGVCCIAGEGECEPEVCGSFATCNSNSSCICAIDVDGGGSCVWAFGFCPPLGTACTSSDECSEGNICWLGSCCDSGVCASPCPASAGDEPPIFDDMVNLADPDAVGQVGDGGLYTEGGLSAIASSCVRVSATDCNAWAGAYWGDGTTCDDITCPECDNVFVHVATEETVLANYTVINHPLTNGDPNAILIVTQDFNPGGRNATPNPTPTGLWYKAGAGKWTIFNEVSSAPIPVGAGFNIEVLEPSDIAFMHVANAGNSLGNSTFIDHPLTNGNPDALLLATQRLGAYNNSPIGVWYSSSRSQWSVFNQNMSAMPSGARFNIELLVLSSSVFIQTATAANILGTGTLIDHPQVNDNPSALLEVTQNRTAGGGTYNNSPIGTLYFGNRWFIFNEDGVSMVLGAAFNVKVASECVGVGPPEACCFVDAFCADMPRDVCWSMNGSPGGAGSTCASETCPLLGACCYWGNCGSVSLEEDCQRPDRTWHAGQFCQDITCPPPPPTGACCAAFTCAGFGTCGTEFPVCGGNFNCRCASTSDGGACFSGGSCDGLTLCPDGNGDCVGGEVCVVDTCCDGPVCMVPGCNLAQTASVAGETTIFGEGWETAAAGIAGTCQHESAAACADLGAIYQGDYTACEGTTCPECDDHAQCDDGLYCNGAEVCRDGFCESGTPPNCNDGVACTQDSCNEGNDRCINLPRDEACDDGQYCNGKETCDQTNGCIPNAPPDCNDSVDCTQDECDEANDRCVNIPRDNRCDNGEFCDGEEVCHPTLDCRSGEPPNCGDGVSCTQDGCDEVNDRCVNLPRHERCDDGEYCNGVEKCDATEDCQLGTPPDCRDEWACTQDGCDEVGDRCRHLPHDEVCSNNQYCDGEEYCDPDSGCQDGPPPDCDDQDDCTVDDCDDGRNECVNVLRDCDGDGVCDDDDNCPTVPNSDQANSDSDAYGDACDGLFDADHDGDVDLFDYADLLDCISGATWPAALQCQDVHDANGDGSVDLLDAAAFWAAFTGSRESPCD